MRIWRACEGHARLSESETRNQRAIRAGVMLREIASACDAARLAQLAVQEFDGNCLAKLAVSFFPSFFPAFSVPRVELFFDPTALR